MGRVIPEYELEALRKKLIVIRRNDEMSTEAQRNAIRLFTIALNYNLSCKRIIENWLFILNGNKYDSYFIIY